MLGHNDKKCSDVVTVPDLLKFLGLEPVFDDNTCSKNFVNCGYTSMIFLFLLYHPVILMYISIDQKKPIYLSKSFFTFIQPVQYCVAYMYFRSQRTKRLYESTNLVFLENPDGIWKYLPEEKKLLKFILTLGVFLVVEAVVTFGININDKDSCYKEYSESIDVLSYIIIPLSFLYGRLVLTLNTHVFFFSFLQQIQKMSSLRDKLSKKRWTEGKNLSVAILCYEIFDIRYTLSRMIRKLEDMYTYSTILGAVGFGLMISERDSTDLSVIISVIIFWIMQIFFLIVIQSVGKERDRFRKIIYHRKFASTYILRRNEFCQACIEVQKESDLLDQTDTSRKNSIDIKESRESLRDDLSKIMKITDHPVSINITDIGPVEIYDEKSSDKFHKRSLGSNEGSETSSIRKRTGSIRLSESTESEDIQRQIKNLLVTGGISDPHVLADSGCSLTTEEFIRCIYEWVSNTGSTVDWIILNTILSEDWASFGMFGIEFSDGSALKKALIITCSLIAAGSTVGFLQVWADT